MKTKWLGCALALGIFFQAAGAQACDQIPVELGKDAPLPYSTCLPDTISRQALAGWGLVPYAPIPVASRPIANGDIYVDGQKKSAEEAGLLDVLFAEKHFAVLPEGARLTIKATSPLTWEYPVGTRFVHEIDWQSWPTPELYELRVMEKLPSGMWAFGIYQPVDGDRLSLRKDEAPHLTKVLTVMNGDRLQTMRVEMDRLHPQSCRHCHFAHGSASYQYGQGQPESMRLNYVGPCGFTPANSTLPKSWAEEYQKAHGYWPFAS